MSVPVCFGAMAQLVAHPTPDRAVGSSILSGLTLFFATVATILRSDLINSALFQTQ